MRNLVSQEPSGGPRARKVDLVQIHYHCLKLVLMLTFLSSCYLLRGLLPWGLITDIPTHYLNISRSYEYYTPLPSYFPCFDCPNNIHALCLIWVWPDISRNFYSTVKAVKSICLMNWKNNPDMQNYAYCLAKYFDKRSLEISKILWKFKFHVLWRQNSCYGMLFLRLFPRRYLMSVSADNW